MQGATSERLRKSQALAEGMPRKGGFWRRVARFIGILAKVGVAIVVIILLVEVVNLENELDPRMSDWREGFGTSAEHVAAIDVAVECLGGIVEECAREVSGRAAISIAWLDSRELRKRPSRDITPYYLGLSYSPAAGREAGYPAAIVLAGVTGVDRSGKMREWRVQVISYDARPRDWEKAIKPVASDPAGNRIYAACEEYWEGTARCLRWEAVVNGRPGFYELLAEWGIEVEKGAAEGVHPLGVMPPNVADRIIPLDMAVKVISAAKYT